MPDSLTQLKERLGLLTDLNGIGALLDWDQQTYMPPGGAAARGDQSGTLSRIRHELLVAPETERLLATAEHECGSLDPDSDTACLLRVVRRDFEQAARVPADLVAEMARTAALAHEPWVRARATSDFSLFAPWLERILELCRRLAQARGYREALYDALLDAYEPGATTAHVSALFSELRPGLVELVDAVRESRQPVDDSCLFRDYPEEAQSRFTQWIVAQIGYDFACGRQDRAVHPFMTGIARGDTRITTRFDPLHLSGALFASLHEAGHALYEQGMPPEFDRSALSGGASLGVHESQSQLWEEIVGRSRPFWRRFYPDLRAAFPNALSNVGEEAFFRAINKVQPSLIRVEADKVTYNLHVMLRFEMETDLLEGRLRVADAPQAWNAKMHSYLGLTPPDDAQGILQDVHWSMGAFGYFPTYAIGNLLAGQLWEQALGDRPEIPDRIAAGDFQPLLAWLRETVHSQGRKFLPADLTRRVTGRSLSPQPYLRYLGRKCADVYGIAS